MKKIIFVLSIIVYFQDNTLTATNIANNNFKKIKDFLDFTDIAENDKKFIIHYFNRPGAGVPIWIRNQPKTKSKKTRISKIIKSLRLLFSKYPQFLSKLKIDEHATALALELRKHTKISPDIHIPIFEKLKFSLEEKVLDRFYFNFDPSDFVCQHIKHPYIKPYIILDSLISKLLPQTIPFRLAHEYSHIEMEGSAIQKTGHLGFATALLSYIFLSHKKYNRLTSIIGSIGSYLVSIFLSHGYFQRQEEKTCDLRAIELTKSYKGIEEFFSHDIDINIIFSNNDWIIVEIIIVLDKPREYTTLKERLFSLHPSDAERIRYCKAFAQKHGYI